MNKILLNLIVIGLVISHQTDSFSASGTHTISNVVDLFEHENTLHFDFKSTVMTVGNRAVVKSQDTSDLYAVITVFDTDLLSALWSVKSPCDFLNVSSGESPCIVVSNIVAEGVIDVSAYALDGDLLFTKDGFAGEIIPSPNGRYFYTTWSIVNWNSFKVFDRNGNFLFSIRNPKYPWHSAPINDSVVAFMTHRMIYFYSVPDGSLLSTVEIPMPKPKSFIHTSIGPNIGGILCFWDNTVLHISSKLSVTWQRSDLGRVVSATSTRDGTFWAVYAQLNDSPEEHQLSFISSDSGNRIWNERIKTKGSECTTSNPSIQITSNFLKIITPQCGFYEKGILTNTTRSYIFQFDAKYGSLKTKNVLEGGVSLAQSLSGLKAFQIKAETQNIISAGSWRTQEQ